MNALNPRVAVYLGSFDPISLGHVSELLIGHEEHGLEVRVELPIGHHHRKFGRDIGQRPNATHHHFRSTFPSEIDGEPRKGSDLHVG